MHNNRFQPRSHGGWQRSHRHGKGNKQRRDSTAI